MTPKDTPAPVIVLDTNIVLDWLVFRDPNCVGLQASMEGGALSWIATRAMRDELVHVLERDSLDSWMPDTHAIWRSWDRWCVQVRDPAPGDPTTRPRCSDPGDQKFIDLAIECKARWLLSRDRAVLRLARPLRGFGVEVTAALTLPALN
jgi:predicted nucleic acid-binding protein